MRKRLSSALQVLFVNNQPRLPWRRIALAAIGTGVAVGLLGWAGSAQDLALVFLGLAPSALLVFALPEAPVSQPTAVVGGHLVAAAIGVGVGAIPVAGWWAGPGGTVLLSACAATLGVAAMLTLRVVHPPAAATAVLACATGASLWYLVSPVLIATVLIVAAGLLWHRFTGGVYPQRTRLR